ncbi:hypothetical protein V6N12_046597 [Hibiscus sabdariffa]
MIGLWAYAYKDGVMYDSSKFVTQEMTGAIIPALMHRIPSELRSKFVTQEMTGAIIPALMHRIPSELRTLAGAAYKDGVMYGSSKFVTQEMTGAIIPALMHRIPSELRTLAGAAYKDGVMYGSSKFVTQEMTGAMIPALMHRIPSELRSEACLGESSTRMALAGAAYKDGVMYGSSKFVTQEMTGAIIPALMHRIPSELRTLAGAAYKDGVMYGSSKFVTQEMMGAIIPALMHRIPSELRSQACLGESSTRMGDLLGSPRVAPLFLVNSAVNRAWVRVELGWVTSWVVLVLHPYFWFGNGVSMTSNPAVKRAWARVVLGWVTSWEVLVLHPIFGLGTAVPVTSNSAVKRAWARVVLGWVTSWEVLVLHLYFWFGNGRSSEIALVGAAYKDGVMYGSCKFVTQEMTGVIIPVLMHRIPSELRSQACLGESRTRMGDLLGSPRVAPLFLDWERPFQ